MGFWWRDLPVNTGVPAAAARRYLSFASEPATVVFSHEGKVRYVKKCDDFPRMSVWNWQPMPQDYHSMTNDGRPDEVTDVVEAVGHHWLEEARDLSLGEQTRGAGQRLPHDAPDGRIRGRSGRMGSAAL